MFYRRESSTVPLGMLADLADITCTPAEFGRIELGYIRKCAGEFANFSYLLNEAISSRGLDKDNPVIGVSFPTFGEQVSILGMLELLATSNEQICEQYLPLCTQALNFISHIYLIIEEDGYGSYGILSELDSFLFELCSRIFRISVEFPTWSMKLTTSVWKWTSDLHQQINDTAEPFHIRLAVAALIGIYRAFNIHSANTVLVDSTQLKMLAELNFSEDKISLAAKAWSAAPKKLGFSTGATKEYGPFQLITAFISALRDVLAGSLCMRDLKPVSFSDIWENLSKLRGEMVHSNTSVFLSAQTAVLCAIYDSSLHEPLISKLVAILEDHTVNYDSTSLDLLLTAIEGLEIMAVSSNTTASSVTHSLITFLVQPANIFLALSDEYMCAILRECACRSLSNILSCRVDANQRKTALYTFVNTLHSTHQKILTATTAKTEFGRRYQNSISAIASLCSALKTKETIDVAIPALARRLDDSQTIFDEFIWKNLGNIGLTDDIEVFRHIVTFIIDYSKRTFSKISKISHTLARMPGRSAALQEIYLEKLLVLFLEKASSLQRTHTDPTVISELRDIMSIVKHLVRVVASKTPPLILDRQRRSLEADLGANSIMQGAFPETVMAKIKNLLVTMFPARIIELRNERLYNTDIYTVLETIADEVLRLFMHSQSFSDVDTHVIEHNMQQAFHRMALRTRFFPNCFFLDEEEAASASADYIGVGEAWFKAAIKRSVYETIGIVQTYLIEISNKSPYTALNDHSNLMVLLSRYTGISEIASTIIKSPSKHSRYLGEIKGMILSYELLEDGSDRRTIFKKISTSLKSGLRNTYRTTDEPNFAQRLNHSLFRAVALIISNPNLEAELLQLVCRVPNVMFDQTVMEIAVAAWGWLMSSQPDITKRVISYLIQAWELTINSGQGLYGIESGITSPFIEKLTYGAPVPSDTVADDSDVHTIWIRFLIDRFRSDRLRGDDYIQIYSQFFEIAARSQHTLSSNWTAREARFALASLGIRVALDLEAASDRGAPYIWTLVFNITLSWFERPPMFGRIKAFDLKKLAQFYYTFKEIKFGKGSFCASSRIDRVLLNNTGSTSRVELSDAQNLVALLLEHEISRLSTWVCPLEDGTVQPVTMQMPPPPNERQIKWASIVRTAWSLNPVVAVQLSARFVTSSETIESEISEISKYNEISCINCSEAATLFLKNAWRSRSDDQLRYLLYWTPVPPIQAIAMLSHSQRIQPWVLQYAVRVLEFFPIDQVFFFIPQMVQALREDTVGYIERFILDAAKSSQTFAHQIIWNMLANMYKDETCEVDYYEREFDFFSKVTGISGTLKPLVQADASKAEKKRKIDEEMRKIKVQAPFMASFKVNTIGKPGGDTRWMSSIFKVGDDCRQDVLALQLISIFKSIFVSAGLDLYTFPYRVVATAPGCGVIEVIPRSISRDMMGREKVNSLYDWFLAEFGPENGIEFQKAQKEFVKSLSAYSLIMFILQIKDRHNGNIMFDKEGHMIHIDFGFILSIAPGGGILEVSPFKLTAEMVQVMGGDINAPAYRQFSELCIKAYLACRPYAEEIISMVSLMMDSGLPCFKGDVTIRKLRERFQLDKSERGAAEFMVNCIRQSHENTRSVDLVEFLKVPRTAYIVGEGIDEKPPSEDLYVIPITGRTYLLTYGAF
ncbi:hypothetical protein BASA60_007187 [Batrachochytrium salamandrivorans]|nr:hypothetical protein BASA60_007187 [Batrachochytrium salamandrivorans]